MKPYRVLLYYQFRPLENLAEVQKIHQSECIRLGLKGRVYFSSEGINGTVAGTLEAVASYQNFVEHTLRFTGIAWKIDESGFIPFEKMKTKVRASLVSLGEGDSPDLVPNGGRRLSPAEWRQTLETESDILLLDVRNRYESEVGRFKGALCPDIENFHEFPEWVSKLTAHKDQKVLMYCTGGIRCEKFSGLLRKNGFKEVYQLDGGILTYAKEENGAYFEGECFVFDDRLTVPVAPQGEIISRCALCDQSESKYLNCSNMECNALFLCCDACAQRDLGACSVPCKNSPGRRPFDPSDFRIPFRKKGVVFPELGRAQK